MAGKDSFKVFIVGLVLIGLIRLAGFVTACGQSYTAECSPAPSASTIILAILLAVFVLPTFVISFLMSVFAMIKNRQRKYAALPFAIGASSIIYVIIIVTSR